MFDELKCRRVFYEQYFISFYNRFYIFRDSLSRRYSLFNVVINDFFEHAYKIFDVKRKKRRNGFFEPETWTDNIETDFSKFYST